MQDTEFTPEEFAARRARVMDEIGRTALAVVQGAAEPSGFRRFRQTNEFHYLTGVEIPHAYLLLDGQRRAAVLYLPQRHAAQAEAARAASGVDRVEAGERLAADLARASLRPFAPTLFTPLAPAEGAAETRDMRVIAAGHAAADAWDGGGSRETRFAEALRRSCPRSEVRDLSPVLDRLRLIKSPAELARMRQAARLCGEGLLAAVRATRPGAKEYELEAAAAHVFRAGGAQGEGYCAIVASGPNIWEGHYNANDRALADGDLVLMDYAPDYGYYTSDIGRMWPADGRYRPWQRELYGFMVEYHDQILKRIRPGATAVDILAQAAAEMRALIERTPFSKPIYEQAARRALDFAGHLSHPVGMAVHDVGDYAHDPLVPGLVFAVDPQMWVPEEHLYVRVEDTVAVTSGGIANLTGFVPRELDALEGCMAP